MPFIATKSNYVTYYSKDTPDLKTTVNSLLGQESITAINFYDYEIDALRYYAVEHLKFKAATLELRLAICKIESANKVESLFAFVLFPTDKQNTQVYLDLTVNGNPLIGLLGCRPLAENKNFREAIYGANSSKIPLVQSNNGNLINISQMYHKGVPSSKDPKDRVFTSYEEIVEAK